MKIDPEGKQLQIDDLIIIPNNLAATPPEGGSALQNLAKIASRYQNQKETLSNPADIRLNNPDIRSSHHHGGHHPHQENLTDYSSATMAKKPKLDHGAERLTMGGGGHAPHHNNPSATTVAAIATPPTNKPVAAAPPPPTTPGGNAASAAAAAAQAASSAASLAALAGMNPMTMTPAQQQSLLSMLPPGLGGLFGMPTPTKQAAPASNNPSKDYSLNNPSSTHLHSSAGGLSLSTGTPTKSTTGSATASSGSSAAASAASGLSLSAMAGLLPPGLGDPSKLGPEALQLLQLYEKTLKAVVGGQTGAGALSMTSSMITGPSKTSSSSSPKPRNASGSSSNAGSPQLHQSAKDRDRNKVNRLPLDAKKALVPQGHTPSAFAQSSTIYTNPLGMCKLIFLLLLFFKNKSAEFLFIAILDI